MSKKRPTLDSVSPTDLLRVERSPKFADPLDGFIVGVGSKWALMHAVREGGYFDGYVAFRVSDVRRITLDKSFATRFAATQPEWPPRSPPNVTLDSTKGLMSALAAHAPLIGLQKERERNALWIGVMRTLAQRWVELHEVGTDARWHKRPSWYEIKAVTAVSIAGLYMKALAEIADFTVVQGYQLGPGTDTRSGEPPIDVGEIVQRLDVVRPLKGPKKPNKRDYSVRVVETSDDAVVVQLLQGKRTARLVVPLPSSTSLTPWVYMRPDDAADWVHQFLIWLDEEMFSGGLFTSRARVDIDGESYVLVQPYGFQQADARLHEELLAAAGPHGWYGRSPS